MKSTLVVWTDSFSAPPAQSVDVYPCDIFHPATCRCEECRYYAAEAMYDGVANLTLAVAMDMERRLQCVR